MYTDGGSKESDHLSGQHCCNIQKSHNVVYSLSRHNSFSDLVFYSNKQACTDQSLETFIRILFIITAKCKKCSK